MRVYILTAAVHDRNIKLLSSISETIFRTFHVRTHALRSEVGCSRLILHHTRAGARNTT